MKRPILFFLLLSLLIYGLEAVAVDMSDYVGYTVVAKKTVEDEFEGCDFDKRIIFTDGTYLTCSEYGYEYAYRPQVTLLNKGSQWVMCMERSDKCYRMIN